MPILIHQARDLCTKREFEFYFASRPREITRLTAARLRSKIARARRLRDKYRGLARTAGRIARGKQAPRASQAGRGARMRRKATLFAEVMARFQKRLKKVEDAARRAEIVAARKKLAAKRKKKAGARKPPGIKRPEPAPATRKAEAAAKRSRLDRSGRKRIETHTAARGRRRQAKRDRRG
jgi:hypothetical protein